MGIGSIGASNGFDPVSLFREAAASVPLPGVTESANRIGEMIQRLFGSDAHPNGTVNSSDPADRTLIASDNAVTAGDLNVSDAYDLRLYQEADGNYTAEVYMKLDFNFENGVDASGNPIEWTEADRQQFIADYETAIENVWDGRVLETLPDGSEVRLDVNLDSRDAPVVLGENWTVNVTKIEPGGFARSSVTPSRNIATLDSEDVVLTTKSGGFQQTGAAHEFGHMIGLLDEYTAGSPNIADTDSIMHGGQVVENRHVEDFGDWVRAQLPN